MGELLVYKASAGSGKTFTLAVEYIKHLIQNPRAYRQILAVTFTNKATAEMKERILTQLYGIWKGVKNSEPYLKKIKESGISMSDEEIRKRAEEALTNMLHDYSRFRIETIDSFFQSVMRNLARELELAPKLNIELNNAEVLSDAVDSMIEKLTGDSPILTWLLEYIQEKITNDKRWNVSEEIKQFGRNIFNESYIERGEMLRKKLQEPRYLKTFRDLLREMEKEALEEMAGFCTKFEKELDSHLLGEEDLSNKSKGISSYFRKLKKGALTDKETVNATLNKHLEGPEAWCSKTHKRRTEIVRLAEQSLLPLLQEAESIRRQRNHTVNSCRLSLQHLNKLQLLNHIDEEVRALNKEHNRFLLSDTNALLHSLMREGDSSFVFEKIGTQIQHVMIDEFQDTSRMQWNNFRLLLLEGLSQGEDSLIVGDVKQSIYRWRNGDWGILNGLGQDGNAEKDTYLPYNIRVETLKVNRRSESRIIRFNNAIFKAAVNYLDDLHEKELKEKCLPLEQAYKDVAQESPKEEQAGYIKVTFIEPDEEHNYTEQILIDMGQEVQRLLQAGVRLNDMAILVRMNKNIPLIAQYFDRELGLTVVSDEAFRLDASEAVSLLIEALRVLANPDDKIAEAMLHSRMQQPNIVFSDFCLQLQELRLLPLHNLLEELYRLLRLGELEKQDGYVLYFFDAVTEYLKRNSDDLEAFLRYWDETLCAKTIPGEEMEGIRIYSIHKSKGLEFHTVLLPFCDWHLENESRQQLVWCTPEEEPYCKLDLVPVNYGSIMAESVYRKDYLHERLQLWVDNLNLLYVALTRAGKNLLIWTRKEQKGTMSELLENGLPEVAQNSQGTWNKEDWQYEWGDCCPSSPAQTATDTEGEVIENRLATHPTPLPIRMESRQPDIEFRQSNRSADFIAGLEEGQEPEWRQLIERGNLLHNVFACIGTADEADEAITRLSMEGIIGSKEQEKEVSELVHRALALPQVADWYSGRWRLFRECDIIWLDKQGSLRNQRPDRVMMQGKEIIVVDFKFGQPRKSYHRQVEGYIRLLKKMGYTREKISGYLWYVTTGQIEEVQLSTSNN
ncbi:MAG: UvrD-helicase domain-containing protein [Bacteroides sp.]|nr:UvrD-helicase domain-containing protein [Bacteroides sp.]